MSAVREVGASSHAFLQGSAGYHGSTPSRLAAAAAVTSAVLNGHLFSEWCYDGLGNAERLCSRCGFQQCDEQADVQVPACHGVVTVPRARSLHQLVGEMLREIGMEAFSPEVQAEAKRLMANAPKEQ